jgi:hypothetical protein
MRGLAPPMRYPKAVAMAINPSSSEEQRLIAEYHVATERYSAAVGELTLHREMLTKEDYVKLLNLVEDARNECERVRNNLKRIHENPAS